MDNFVARQAIFDRKQSVYAYELLFRSSTIDRFDGSEASLATSQVIANTLFSIGLDNMLSGKRAFINFGRNLLLGDWTTILPASSVVIEVLETVEPDSDVLEACRNLRSLGYLVALDDFICHPRFDPLTSLADIIKVDIRITSHPEQLKQLARYRASGVKMLAEKVETQEEFEWSRNAGYDYFQGYFFARPVLVKGRQVPGIKTNQLKLLEQLQQPSLDFAKLEKLIANDVSFSFRVMRYVNSGAFSHSYPVQSIRQALIILGERETRKWISLATLPTLARDKADEVVVHAMVRARFCEMLAGASQPSISSADASLMGMFSLLDAMIDRPLAQILCELKLSPMITEALLGSPGANNPFGMIWQLVQNYEAGSWDAVGKLSQQLGLGPGVVTPLYLEALRWSADLFRDVSAKQPARARSAS